jgi:hypothetical protein
MRLTSTPWVLVCAAIGVGGCLLADPDTHSSPCVADTDCPSTHRCVQLSAEQGVCELIYPPPGDTSAGQGDGGPSQSGDAGTPDAGPRVTPTWCKDIQPVMQASCTASCHGAVNTDSGQKGFRLDVYATSGSVKGAKDMAARIKDRGVDKRTMPPSTSGSPALTAAQRDLVTRWVAGGTPECAGDGGTP